MTTIIAKNITDEAIAFPDLGGFYIAASGTENLTTQFKGEYITQSSKLSDNVQIGNVVINDGTKDLSIERGLKHISGLTYHRILEYLEGLTIVGLSDTPDSYSGNRYYIGTPSGIEWVTLEELFYSQLDVNTISGALYGYIESVHDDFQGQIDGVVFGLNFQEAEEAGPISTTSKNFSEALTLITSSLPPANYKVGWCFEWNMSNSSYPFVCRVQVDDTTTLMETNIRTPDANSWNVLSGHKCIDLTSGSHDIDVDFKSSKNGKTASIRNIRLEFWRIS